MKTRLILVLATLTACDSGNGPPLPQASSLHVLHAIRGGPSLTVSVDGARGSRLAFGGRAGPFSRRDCTSWSSCRRIRATA